MYGVRSGVEHRGRRSSVVTHDARTDNIRWFSFFELTTKVSVLESGSWVTMAGNDVHRPRLKTSTPPNFLGIYPFEVCLSHFFRDRAFALQVTFHSYAGYGGWMAYGRGMIVPFTLLPIAMLSGMMMPHDNRKRSGTLHSFSRKYTTAYIFITFSPSLSTDHWLRSGLIEGRRYWFFLTALLIEHNILHMPSLEKRRAITNKRHFL